MDVQQFSLTTALDGGKWSASRLCRFNPSEIAPWADLRVYLDAFGEEINFFTLTRKEPRLLCSHFVISAPQIVV